jgi:hypothetical protein
MNGMNSYNDRVKRWTSYIMLQSFDCFDQTSDKSNFLQKCYNDSLNHYTFYELLNMWQSVI